MKYKIGFSALNFDQGKSGISSYIKGLLGGLFSVDIENSYDIFCLESDEKALSFHSENFHLRKVSSWCASPLMSILWHNSVFARQRLQLVHIPTMRRIPLIKSCPVVATIHDLAPFRMKEKYDPLRLFYHHNILSRLIHRVDHVIAVSAATKADIIEFTKYPAEKISVIYSGIDHSTFYPTEQIRDRPPFILYVSRLEHPGKNHLRLIEAYNALREKKRIDHQLVLVGAKWSGAEKVEQAIEKSPYKRDIIYLGFVDNASLKKLVGITDLMVFPSLYEGFGLPAIEALASGVKVVCSNVASLKELVEGYGELFDPYDVDSIQAGIERGLSWDLKKDELERQLSYAKSFQWESCAKQVQKVYKSLLR